MITLYHPGTPADPEAQPARSRRCPPASFLNQIEAKRYEFIAAKLRENGLDFYADLCDRWAEEHRLTVLKLAEVDRRMGELDGKLYTRAILDGLGSDDLDVLVAHIPDLLKDGGAA